MKRDLEETALPARVDARRAFDGAALEVAADQVQASWPLGDEHAPVGQEGERPWMIEPLHELHHPELGLGAKRQRE